MPRETSSPRRQLLVSFAVVVVVALAGCEPIGGSTAATVGDRDISTERVLSLLKDRKTAAEREAQTGAQATLAGPGKDTFSKRAFADTLNQLVLAELVDRDLDRRNVRVKRSDLTRARSSLEQSAGADTVRKLPKNLRDFVIRFSAAQALLQKQVGNKAPSKETQARAQYAQIKSATPEQLLQLCVTGAVFGSRSAATTARARLASGASVSEATKGLQVQQVAAQEQCGAASQLPPAAQSLEIGGVTEPIANQGTFVVLRLERRKTLSFADVRAQLEQGIPEPGAAELQAEIRAFASKAKVDVDPRFGRWNRRARRVDPPARTPTTTAPPTPSTPGSGSGGGGTAGGSGAPSSAPPTSQPGS